MGIIKLKIVDEKDEEVLIEDLTNTGLQMLITDLKRLQKRIDEI